MSKAFEFNREDMMRHLRAMAIYLAPTALILVTQLQEQSDATNIFYAMAFSAVLDFLRRYIANNNLQITNEEV